MTLLTGPYALVVDDDAMEAGFRCLEASTGDEAVEVLKKHDDSITLLFTDVEMPGSMNGFALARHVAKHWPDVEIVVASGRISPADGDMPEKATFISKPFSADLVHNHLREKLPDGKKPEPLKQAI